MTFVFSGPDRCDIDMTYYVFIHQVTDGDAAMAALSSHQSQQRVCVCM